MTFIQATPLKSSDQTIATMISLLGLLTLTSPALAMDVLITDVNQKVILQDKQEIMPQQEQEFSIETVKEKATPKKKKHHHSRVATSNVEAKKTVDVKIETKEVTKATDIKDKPKKKEPVPTKEVLNTAHKEEAPIVIPATVPVIDSTYLQNLNAELTNFAGIAKTDCTSCFGTAIKEIPIATQDVIHLLNEIIAAGNTLLSEVGPIVQLFHAIQNINTSANATPLKSAQPVLTKDQKKINKKVAQASQEIALRNLNHLSKDARTALLHHQNLMKNAPVSGMKESSKIDAK